jgi:hypothetical protein
VLRTANTLDPFNVRTENSLKLVTELAGYSTIQTEHFVMRYKPGVDEVLARRWPRCWSALRAGDGQGRAAWTSRPAGRPLS